MELNAPWVPLEEMGICKKPFHSNLSHSLRQTPVMHFSHTETPPAAGRFCGPRIVLKKKQHKTNSQTPWGCSPSICEHSFLRTRKQQWERKETTRIEFHYNQTWVQVNTPFCRTAPLLSSVTQQQNITGWWWEGSTSAAIPPSSVWMLFTNNHFGGCFIYFRHPTPVQDLTFWPHFSSSKT